MSARSLSAVLRSSSVASRAIVLRGGHHHAPPPPPFARLPIPSGKLPLNRDLVWTDSVAPELVIDFDSPHISTARAFWSLVGTLAMFPLLLGVLTLSNPDGSRKAAKRGDHLPDLRWEFGQIDEPEGEIEALE